jgi:hypothetical protein
MFSPALSAASLQSATVTQTRNEVQLSEGGGQARPAVVQDRVDGKDTLRTGKKSRAELLFNDDTIARLGANSVFSFVTGTDQMKIDRGSALIHVPPGHPGAKIKSPAATVAVLGDVVAMRIGQRGVTQIVALSEDPRGPITVMFDKTGERVELRAGEMLVIDPADVKMPKVSVINVEVFARSSGLVNGFGKPLPESAKREIQQSLDEQNKQIKGGTLEGPAQASIPDMQELPSTDPTIVQAAIGNSVAGTYRGLAKDLFPGVFVGNMTLNINSDSSFSGTIKDTVSAFTTSFTGNASNNGNFTAIDDVGQVITGTVKLGGGSASGSYVNPGGVEGVFNVNK